MCLTPIVHTKPYYCSKLWWNQGHCFRNYGHFSFGKLSIMVHTVHFVMTEKWLQCTTEVFALDGSFFIT